jgi:hypothetical protein
VFDIQSSVNQRKLMPASRPEYRQGRIVWVYLRTAKGKREEHPAVILSDDSQIVQPKDFDPRAGNDNIIVVAGISTKYRNHANPFVRIPFLESAAGHPISELRRDCAAIVGWYQAIFIPDDVTAMGGDVPTNQMRELNSKALTAYIATVGNQYTTSLEMLSELKQQLLKKDSPKH